MCAQNAYSLLHRFSHCFHSLSTSVSICVCFGLSIFLSHIFAASFCAHVSPACHTKQEIYSNSDFITEICVTLCLVFPLDRSYCIFKWDKKHALTWIRESFYLNMHACMFFQQKFSLEQSWRVFLSLRLLSTDRIHNECLDVREHIYLHPYGSRITNSISKCIHFSEQEKKIKFKIKTK